MNNIRSEILRRRYLKKDRDGKVIETEDKMFHRVANTIATVESKYGATEAQVRVYADRFYRLMKNYRFLPNTPTLLNAGRENGMLSACFVLPFEDSIEGVFETVKNTALIQKAGGGTGFAFDNLRPTGDIVRSSGGTTSGPISFWRVLSETTHAIQQGAFRRGANMGMMSIKHPDIIKFIKAKSDLRAFNNFNISVKIPNSFMRNLVDSAEAPHMVINPRTRKRYVIPRSLDVNSYTIDDLVPAEHVHNDCYTVREIWDMIVTNAHSTGEPGICYIDRVNEDNPTPYLGVIEATNPCGEQPLLPYEACNLGSINIAALALDDRSDLDWNQLKETVRLAIRFLDDVVDASHWPVPEIKKITLGNRKVGLGVMGFADSLILQGIRYDCEEAVAFGEKLASFIQKEAHEASETLAREKGNFPNWAGSVWNTMYHRAMRNAACTTIAPTGTLSLIAGCNGGIEPIFSISARRKVLDCQEILQLCPVVEHLGTKDGWLSGKVHNLLVEGVPPQDIPEIPRKLAEVLLTAHEIAPEWHVRIQAAFQKYTDNAVSKTVNLPSDASVEDVDRIFRLAYELGCKGITVYRNRSRENQVITATHIMVQPMAKSLSPRSRPKKTKGETVKFRTGCGTLFVTVNKDDNGLCEVFANLGKAGGCAAQTEATCRAVSIALRSGVDPGVLIEQLRNIRCLSTMARRKTNNDITVVSCADAIAAGIEEALNKSRDSTRSFPVNKCPDCGQTLRFESGCDVCSNCGYSKCG